MLYQELLGGDIMKYNPLGIKTEYTLLSSLIKIKDLIEFAKINNITALGLLDDNLNGVMEFYDNCLLNNIKPLIGLKVTLDNKDLYLCVNNNYSLSIVFAKKIDFVNVSYYYSISQFVVNIIIIVVLYFLSKKIIEKKLELQ